MEMKNTENPISDNYLRDYIDQCIMVNNADNFNDLSYEDKEAIVSNMLTEASQSSRRADKYDVLIRELNYNTVDNLEKLCHGKITPEEFKKSLIEGICKSEEENINDIFKERINYFQNDPFKNADYEYDMKMDTLSILDYLFYREIKNDNKNRNKRYA